MSEERKCARFGCPNMLPPDATPVQHYCGEDCRIIDQYDLDETADDPNQLSVDERIRIGFSMVEEDADVSVEDLARIED